MLSLRSRAGEAERRSATLTVPTSASPGWHSVSAAGAASALAAQSAFLVIGPLRGQVEDVGFWSKALQSRINVGVYLPPGYENGAQRYPVVYFLHGLPAHETAYRSHVRFAAAYVEALSKAALVVVPQAARVGDNDPEYLDWGLGRNWETAISVELPRFVDTRFRTVAERRGRALVGLSAGGYGAVLSGPHHRRTFSVLESWGGTRRSSGRTCRTASPSTLGLTALPCGRARPARGWLRPSTASPLQRSRPELNPVAARSRRPSRNGRRR